MSLYVEVIWVGAQLPDVVRSLPSTTPVLALTWTPGEVTAFGEWHPVAFPPCGFDENAPGCVYDSRRIVKLVSNRVRDGARYAYEVIKLGQACMCRSRLGGALCRSDTHVISAGCEQYRIHAGAVR